MCSWHICIDKWWVTAARRDLYSVALILTHSPTLDINQSSGGGSGHRSSLVLSLQLVVTWHDSSVRALWLVLIGFNWVMEKHILIPSQVRIWIHTSWDALRLVGKVKLTHIFSCTFSGVFPQSPTQLIRGSVGVCFSRQPHKLHLSPSQTLKKFFKCYECVSDLWWQGMTETAHKVILKWFSNVQ